MSKLYQVYNGASSVGAPSAVASGTSAKTMLQLFPSAAKELAVCEWSWSGDSTTANTPGRVELMFHDNVTTPATVTAYTAADIKKFDPNSVASNITLGTTSSGYTASNEGTSVTPFNFVQQVSPTTGILIQYAYGSRPECKASGHLRLRNTFGTSVNAICSVSWEE